MHNIEIEIERLCKEYGAVAGYRSSPGPAGLTYAVVYVPDRYRRGGYYRGPMVIGVGGCGMSHSSVVLAWQDAVARMNEAGWPEVPPKHPEYR